MSDWDDDISLEEEEAPSLETEEGRDAWIEFLLTQTGEEDWDQCQAHIEDENMVIRFRWADGTEEVYDCKVRRSMQVVRPAGEEGTN